MNSVHYYTTSYNSKMPNPNYSTQIISTCLMLLSRKFSALSYTQPHVFRALVTAAKKQINPVSPLPV